MGDGVDFISFISIYLGWRSQIAFNYRMKYVQSQK